MFTSAELPVTIHKKEYDNIMRDLRIEIFNLQQSILKANIPVLILIEGVPGSGRGNLINLLNSVMDSRHLRNRTFWMLTDEEKNRPEYWKFWRVLPAKGQVGIFFGGWYDKVNKAVRGKMETSKFDSMMSKVNSFEKLLTDDGMVIIKLWLHKSKENFKKNDKYKMKDPFTVKDANNDYDDIIKWYSRTVRMTNSAYSRWYIINANNDNNRDITAIQTIISCMKSALAVKKLPELNVLPPVMEQQKMILDSVDLTATLDNKVYENMLKKYQTKLYKLSIKAYQRGISSIILFEGWDAAGKGGAIRRIIPAIDARIRQTIQIAAPTDEEKLYHYLWRFWRHVPLKGFCTIYDRSWYGRVLVERVENFASRDEWVRAYSEINSFEEQLVNSDVVLTKFWLHISPEEQLKRFKEREEIEWKQYKITEEDWRNREKMPLYMDAVNDMFINTSTDIAKWHMIAANNKKFARIKVLQTVCEALKTKLKESD